MADIKFLTELAVAGDDRLPASPMRFLLVVVSAILYQFAAKPLHLPGEVVELLALGHRIKRNYHRAFTPPQGKGGAIGLELIFPFAFGVQFAVFLSI